MDASYIYWFTRIEVIDTILSLLIIPPLLYLLVYAVLKTINYVDDEVMPEKLAKHLTTKRAIISAIAFVVLMIAGSMVPSKQDLRMMLAVELATEHGIKIQLEK